MQSHTAFSKTKDQVFKGLVLNRAQAFHLMEIVEENTAQLTYSFVRSL